MKRNLGRGQQHHYRGGGTASIAGTAMLRIRGSSHLLFELFWAVTARLLLTSAVSKLEIIATGKIFPGMNGASSSTREAVKDPYCSS